MLDIIDDCRPQPVEVQTWLSAGGAPLEVMASLKAGLTRHWEVMEEVDPAGECSLIVIPVSDDSDDPTFLFYVVNGEARVATIRDDIWESEQVFGSHSDAVAAILAASAADHAVTESAVEFV